MPEPLAKVCRRKDRHGLIVELAQAQLHHLESRKELEVVAQMRQDLPHKCAATKDQGLHLGKVVEPPCPGLLDRDIMRDMDFEANNGSTLDTLGRDPLDERAPLIEGAADHVTLRARKNHRPLLVLVRLMQSERPIRGPEESDVDPVHCDLEFMLGCVGCSSRYLGNNIPEGRGKYAL